MERERWIRLYELARQLSRGWREGCRYSPATIVGVFLWAVVHDRPASWACQLANWPAELVGRGLPSQSTMSRRLKSESVRRLLELLETQFKAELPQDGLKFIDAKPLVVSGVSKDPEAARGYGVSGYAKGYKLYAIWGAGCIPYAREVHPMNLSEKRVARRLIGQLTGHGRLVGDSAYDANPLYDLAAKQGHQLAACRHSCRGGGLGHRRQSPHRMKGIALLENAEGKELLNQRLAIERAFGHCTSFGGGLAPLPPWVRRLPRVRLWVQAKLLVNALRICEKVTSNVMAIA
jgi:Transposase DDE domain